MDRTAIMDEFLERATFYPARYAQAWAIGASEFVDCAIVAANRPDTDF